MNKISAARPGAPLRGRVRVPGDKSISHRALLLGALTSGASQVTGFLPSDDCLATMACLRALGVEIETHDPTTLTIQGRGSRGLQAPTTPLNCVRSGTSMRLLAGLLVGHPLGSASQPCLCTLTGDEQLLRRPMRRIVEPLRQMGAEIEATDDHAPLTIRGRRLRGYDHTLSIASAQVKSALLLAGLHADGPTIVRQPGPARDHTERMLAAMGANIEVNGLTVILSPLSSPLFPLSLTPGTSPLLPWPTSPATVRRNGYWWCGGPGATGLFNVGPRPPAPSPGFTMRRAIAAT